MGMGPQGPVVAFQGHHQYSDMEAPSGMLCKRFQVSPIYLSYPAAMLKAGLISRSHKHFLLIP